MCNFFSGIVKRDYSVLTDGNSSSHEVVIKQFKLDDKLPVGDERRDWVRFELTPKDVLSVKRSDWIFKVDDEFKPEWFHRTHEDACWDYLNKNVLKAKWMSSSGLNRITETSLMNSVVWSRKH